jgi:formylglycine-generating enzyme required for sulfatase activity
VARTLQIAIVCVTVLVGILIWRLTANAGGQAVEKQSLLAWATIVAHDPDPAVVTDAAARARIAATGLPWKVRDNATGIVMLLCPPGEFTMGSPASETGRDDDEVQHRRVIRKAFYLSETEVTQEAWEKLMGGNPSYFKGAANPVEQVSWNDCVRFCGVAGLRLPTEAEWEYACRAGTTGAYAGDLASMAWFADNSGSQSRPVRQRKPNAWGLYDMHGSVWELVEDAYAPYPAEGGTEEPARTAEGGARVMRGGGWFSGASGCHSASRGDYAPGFTLFTIGFRVARTPD